MELQTRSKIDELVVAGAPITWMEQETGVRRGSILFYIQRSEQHEQWRRNRLKVKQEKKAEEEQKTQTLEALVSALKAPHYSLITTLKARQYELAQESWPDQMALRYLSLKPTSSYPYSKIVEVFEIVEEARNSGTKKSLNDIEVLVGIHFVEVGRIIKTVGVEPMYGSHVRKSMPENKREAMERGYGWEMTAKDIAYFLGLEPHAAKIYFRKKGIRPRSNVVRHLAVRGLSLSLLSQIYEVQDLDFVQDEIAQLLNRKIKSVEFGIANRYEGNNYGERIINTLRTLHADNSIITPYLKR